MAASREMLENREAVRENKLIGETWPCCEIMAALVISNGGLGAHGGVIFL